MSSVFVPESSGSPQQQKQPEQARPKRPRSSLAVSVAMVTSRKKKGLKLTHNTQKVYSL